MIAEGRTDRGIAKELYVTPKTVEAHVRSIFRKLELPREETENRRVHAVLTFLGAAHPDDWQERGRVPDNRNPRAAQHPRFAGAEATSKWDETSGVNGSSL